MVKLMEHIYKLHPNNTTYYEVDSNYGHDAFLVEIDKFSNYIADVLNN